MPEAVVDFGVCFERNFVVLHAFDVVESSVDEAVLEEHAEGSLAAELVLHQQTVDAALENGKRRVWKLAL